MPKGKGTDLVASPGDELVNIATGEVLPATPENAAALLVVLRDLRARLLEMIKRCEGIVAEESTRQGTRTLSLGGIRAKVAGGDDIDWDVAALRGGLERAGCPQERLDALITQTVDYKVDRSVARQLAAANPKYAKVIEAAQTRRPKPIRVSV